MDRIILNLEPGNKITNLNTRSKTLIYLFGSLGDSIVAIPALRAVRRYFSGSEIVLLQNTASDGVVAASEVIGDDLIDRVLSYRSEPGKREPAFGMFRLWRMLRRERFDAAVYLVVSQRPHASVIRDKLFFRSCGIKRLFGFHAFSDEQLYPKDSNGRPAMTDQEAVRKLKRLATDGIEFTKADLAPPLILYSEVEISNAADWLAERRRKPDAKLIAIAPGCKTKANAWPLENFIEIGNRLITERGFEIAVFGGPGDRAAADELITAWGDGINAAGEFTVRESGALLSLCDLYFGLDTGTTHLAAAVGTRCFAVFGERNNPGHWYPLGSGNSVIFHPVECAGCLEFDCPIPGRPCMNGISAKAAWLQLKEFIDAPAQTDLKVTAV